MKTAFSKVFLLIILTTTGNAFSQNNKTFLAQVELKGKHGCINVQGKEVIPVNYDNIGFWGNNLIAVNKGAIMKDYLKTGGKWGYCDTSGKLKIPLQFEEAETFYEGKAAVKQKGKWGFIDTTGKLVIAPQYDEARIFKGGLCAVAKGKKWGIIDAAGKEVVKFEYGELNEFENGIARAFVGEFSEDGWEESTGGYCYINIKGERLFEPKYKSIRKLTDGLAAAEVATGKEPGETKYGYINEKGELVIPAIYDVAEEFSEGIAVVGIKIPGNGFTSSYQYGLINKSGEVIVKPQYSRVSKFEHGKAVVEKGGREFGFVTYTSTNDSILNHETLPQCALIDKQGNFILNFDWQQLYILDKDLLLAHRAKYNGTGLINSKGEVIVPFDYVNLKEAGNNLFISERKGGRENENLVVDINNKIVFKSNIYFIYPKNPAVKLLFIRNEKNNKCGLINSNGQIVLKEKYDSITDFYETE